MESVSVDHLNKKSKCFVMIYILNSFHAKFQLYRTTQSKVISRGPTKIYSFVLQIYL